LARDAKAGHISVPQFEVKDPFRNSALARHCDDDDGPGTSPEGKPALPPRSAPRARMGAIPPYRTAPRRAAGSRSFPDLAASSDREGRRRCGSPPRREAQ